MANKPGLCGHFKPVSEGASRPSNDGFILKICQRESHSLWAPVSVEKEPGEERTQESVMKKVNCV